MSAPYPWLRLYASLLDDRRLLLAAADLRRSEAEVLGYLATLMLWAGAQAQDGIVRETAPGSAAVLIERAARWRGKAGRLAAVLTTHGLVDVVPGGLRLSDWEEQQSSHVAKLERDRVGAARRRSESSEEPADDQRNAPETDAGPSRGSRAGVARDIGDKRETEKEKEKEAAAAASREKPAHIGNPKPPDRSLTDDEQAVLAAWNAAASANGRPVATTLAASMRSHAKSQINAHGLEAVARTFALVCAFAPLWEPGGRGWIASLGWVLKTSDIVERARAGTYGPWVPPAPCATVARAQCACCGRPSTGHLYGADLCQAHAAEAVQYEAGARAWVESRRAA